MCGVVRYQAQGEPARTTSYEHRSDESGHWIGLNFCPRGGTTLSSTFEKELGQISILGGTRSRQRWLPLPEGIHAFEKSASAS